MMYLYLVFPHVLNVRMWQDTLPSSSSSFVTQAPSTLTTAKYPPGGTTVIFNSVCFVLLERVGSCFDSSHCWLSRANAWVPSRAAAAAAAEPGTSAPPAAEPLPPSAVETLQHSGGVTDSRGSRDVSEGTKALINASMSDTNHSHCRQVIANCLHHWQCKQCSSILLVLHVASFDLDQKWQEQHITALRSSNGASIPVARGQTHTRVRTRAHGLYHDLISTQTLHESN